MAPGSGIILGNKPRNKMPARSNNAKISKRPINRTQALNRGCPVSPKQRIVYVGTNSPFMGVVSRVRKALDDGPAGVHANASTKGLPLTARIAAVRVASSSSSPSPVAADHQEVLVRGTGRAMAKMLEVAAWFTRQPDVRVSVRTMTLQAVDDLLVDGDGAEDEGGFAEEEATRVRMVNCLEVGVSLR